MRTSMLMATAGLGLMAAGLAAAQGPGRGPGLGMGPGMGPGPMMAERMEMIDADGDGLIGRAELADWRGTVFDAMDADSDEALSREEYMAVQMGRGADPDARGPRYAEMQAAKAAAFDAMDADGDGLVSRETFVSAADDMIAAGDTDGDGAIGPSEFRGLHRGF
jgi:Ca2+-binding EF-hand superfamily protein